MQKITISDIFRSVIPAAYSAVARPLAAKAGQAGIQF